MGSNSGSNRLEICVAHKPVEGPLQIAEGVLESFCPILRFVEALSDGVAFDFVILDSANNMLVKLQFVK